MCKDFYITDLYSHRIIGKITFFPDNKTERVERQVDCQGCTVREIGSQACITPEKVDRRAWTPPGGPSACLFSVDRPARGTEAAPLHIARVVRTRVLNYSQSGPFI